MLCKDLRERETFLIYTSCCCYFQNRNVLRPFLEMIAISRERLNMETQVRNFAGNLMKKPPENLGCKEEFS